MTVIGVDTDEDDLSVTVVAEFGAPVEQVWELWADPRRRERWWGPPSFPATFADDDLAPGGEVRYAMTGPDGRRHRGLWRVTAVDRPTGLEFEDLTADADGQPSDALPVTRVSVRLHQHDGGTRMTMVSRFASRADLERWLESGTREGQARAVAQMDALLGG